MKPRELTEQDLRRELQEWRERYPRLKDDELFLAWFLRAFVTENEQEAVESLTGGSGDKDADSVLFDDRARIVYIVQGKYRRDVWGKTESRNDVKSFAELALDLCGEEDFFKTRLKGTSPNVRQKFQEARRRITGQKWRLQLYYVTIGRVSSSVRDQAASIVRRYSDVASVDIFDGHQVLLMLADYLDGVAPPVPSLDLPLETGDGVQCSGPLFRKDGKTGIEAWVFSMNATSVADMFERAGVRLFARNVRGFLGKTEINEGMQNTIEEEPWHFWYYNNGITIICDHAERKQGGGRDVMALTNPQVINGQQTTRMLHACGRDGKGASVLVRVIQVPRELGDGSDGFETLVSNIVQATNWQNEISPSDLMSNDRRQIELERQFRKLGYLYIRKRQTKGEARRAAAAAYSFMVKKEEIAQAVAACDFDPSLVRKGKENLFEERWYSQVFPSGDPNYYMPRYWLARAASYAARGYPERAYAKWMVTHFIWQRLRPLVVSKAGATVFRQQNEVWSDTYWAMDRTLHIAFRAVLRFYRAKRGKGAKAIDVSTFFQRTKLDAEFARFWDGGRNIFRGQFRKAWTRFERALKEEVHK